MQGWCAYLHRAMSIQILPESKFSPLYHHHDPCTLFVSPQVLPAAWTACLPGLGHWPVLRTASAWKYYMYQHGNIINMQIFWIVRCRVSVPLTEVCMNMQKLGNSRFQNSCFWIANAYFASDLVCMRRALLWMLWQLPRMVQRPSVHVYCHPLWKMPAVETVPKGPAI